jgi:hypothetical protein
MLREDIYIKTANEFGVSVGMATIMGYSYLKDSVKKIEKGTYKKMDSELSVNKLITTSIKNGTYQKLQRELYRLRKEKGKRKISELTIYKQASNNINNISTNTPNDDSKTNTKRKKIYSNG